MTPDSFSAMVSFYGLCNPYKWTLLEMPGPNRHPECLILTLVLHEDGEAWRVLLVAEDSS
jgi:hypothetical protein